MMTTSKKSGRTQVATESTTLTSLEEKVVRMRRGLRAPDSLTLERADGGNAEVAAKLAEIEQRALAHTVAPTSATKRKIVEALRTKSN